MIEILLTIVIYIIGVMVALKMIENMCHGEELDYPMVFFVSTSSWLVVFLLIGKTMLNKIMGFVRKKKIMKATKIIPSIMLVMAYISLAVAGFLGGLQEGLFVFGILTLLFLMLFVLFFNTDDKEIK